MELLRGVIALGLCWSMSFPVPLALAQDAAEIQKPTETKPTGTKHRPEYASGQLQGDARILHALNRFTFGPRPGDVEAVRSMGSGEMGLDKWFDGQLHPESLDETDLNARLAEYPAMQWSTQDLMFRMPSPAIIRQAADGKIDIPRTGTLRAVYENQIYRYQLKKAAQAEKQTAAAANQAPNQGQNSAGTQTPAMSGNGTGNTNMDGGREHERQSEQ
jgi:hypothetical protein